MLNILHLTAGPGPADAFRGAPRRFRRPRRAVAPQPDRAPAATASAASPSPSPRLHVWTTHAGDMPGTGR